MSSKLINRVLIATCLTAATGLIVRGQHYARLNAEVDTLEARVGSTTVAHPDKYFVRVLTEEPGNLSWHVYVPPMDRFRSFHGICDNPRHPVGTVPIGTTVASYGIRQNYVARFRVRRVDGQLRLYVYFPDASSGDRLLDEAEAYLWDHLDECDVSVAGKDGGTEFGSEEVVTLLSIQARPELVRKAKSSFPGAVRLVHPFVVCFGKPEAVATMKANK